MIFFLLVSLLTSSLCTKPIENNQRHYLASPLKEGDIIMISGKGLSDKDFRISLRNGTKEYFHLKANDKRHIICSINVGQEWLSNFTTRNSPVTSFMTVLRYSKNVMNVYFKGTKSHYFSCGVEVEKAEYLIFEKNVKISDVSMFNSNYSLPFTSTFGKNGVFEVGDRLDVWMVYLTDKYDSWDLQLIDSNGNIPLHMYFDKSQRVQLYAYITQWEKLGKHPQNLYAYNFITITYIEEDKKRKFNIYVNGKGSTINVGDLRKETFPTINGLRIIGRKPTNVDIIDVHLHKKSSSTATFFDKKSLNQI